MFQFEIPKISVPRLARGADYRGSTQQDLVNAVVAGSLNGVVPLARDCVTRPWLHFTMAGVDLEPVGKTSDTQVDANGIEMLDFDSTHFEHETSERSGVTDTEKADLPEKEVKMRPARLYVDVRYGGGIFTPVIKDKTMYNEKPSDKNQNNDSGILQDVSDGQLAEKQVQELETDEQIGEFVMLALEGKIDLAKETSANPSRVVPGNEPLRRIKFDEFWQLQQVMDGMMNIVGPRINQNFYDYLEEILPSRVFSTFTDVLNLPGLKPGVFDPLQYRLLGFDERTPELIIPGVHDFINYYGTPRHNAVSDLRLAFQATGRQSYVLAKKLMRLQVSLPKGIRPHLHGPAILNFVEAQESQLQA